MSIILWLVGVVVVIMVAFSMGYKEGYYDGHREGWFKAAAEYARDKGLF